MKKILGFIIFGLCTFSAYATVQCVGVPERVYAGFHGAYPAEQSFAVMLENSGGKIVLGHVTDDLARARYSMALAAQRSSSELVIQFYSFSSPDDCNTAISAKAIPTSMYTE